MVDLFVLIIIGYITITNLSKGIVRIMLELALFCLCLFLSYFVFRITQNFFIGASTLIISSLIVSILTKLFQKLSKSRYIGRPREISFLNSLLGGAVGLLGGTVFALMILFVADMIPEKTSFIVSIKKEIRHSRSFQIIKFLAKKYQIISTVDKLHNLSKIIEDKERLEKLRKQADFQELLNNERLRAVLSDEETLKQIQDKDIIKIMGNPKFSDLLGDFKLMRQFLNIDFNVISEENHSGKQPPQSESSPK